MEIINKNKDEYIINNSNDKKNKESSGDDNKNISIKNRGCLPSSTITNNFEETGGIITDNEYEVTSEIDERNFPNTNNSRGIKIQ